MDKSEIAEKLAEQLIEITKKVRDLTIKANSLNKEDLKVTIARTEFLVEKYREKMERSIEIMLAAIGGLFGVMLNQAEFNSSLRVLNITGMLSQNLFGTVMIIVFPVAFSFFWRYRNKYLDLELNRRILVEIYLDRF